MPNKPKPMALKYTGQGVAAKSMWLRGIQVTTKNKITAMPMTPPSSSSVAPTLGLSLRVTMPMIVGTSKTTKTCATLVAGILNSLPKPAALE